MVREIVIYPDNTACVNGRFKYHDDTLPILQQYDIPSERDYDLPAVFYPLDNGGTLKIVVFGEKPVRLSPANVLRSKAKMERVA